MCSLTAKCTAAGTLTFTPGITLQTALITVLDDDLPEPDEVFFLVLTYTNNTVLGLYPTATITITDDGDPYVVFLPLVMKRWPPIPYTPILNSVSNPDQDNYYTVSWANADLAQTYILEEAANSNFSGSRVVYQGPSLSWTVPSPGKTPADYHYRVRALNSWGDSPWSNVRVVTIYPLFVGLQLRWDGNGYIRGCVCRYRYAFTEKSEWIN